MESSLPQACDASKAAGAIALEFAQAAKGVSKPFAAAAGRAAASGFEKLVPALAIVQGSIALQDAKEAYAYCSVNP